MRALLCFAPQSTHSSARLTPLAATVLASLAQLSAYTAHFAQAESQTQTGVICLSLALFAHSALLAYTAHFAQAESHTQTGVICPSLALLAHSALLEDSARYARTVPPGGRSGRHLVARVPMTYPTIHQSFSQIGPQTAEQLAGT